MTAKKLSLFEGFGIELEYMIVDRERLDVLPAADRVLEREAGAPVHEVEVGPVAWSNELVAHVIEIKTNGPIAAIDDRAAGDLLASVRRIDALLGDLGGRLLPTAMHPTMDPRRETRLWPHENRPIYAAYDRIFGCRGHGWSNLQSCHLNLPFGNDQEFGKLHAAIRPILALLPALAASSPIVEGRLTGKLDTRLAVYALNQRKLPSIGGRIIPERVYDEKGYRRSILQPMFADIAPVDPEGLLQHEWLNSRGAIARFERDAIEMRLLDVQETPRADLAIAWLVSTCVEALVRERWVSQSELRELDEHRLRWVLDATTELGERAVVGYVPLLRAVGVQTDRASAGEVWAHLRAALLPAGGAPGLTRALDLIGRAGPLARRMLTALGPEPSRSRIVEVYLRLADCLVSDALFEP